MHKQYQQIKLPKLSIQFTLVAEEEKTVYLKCSIKYVYALSSLKDKSLNYFPENFFESKIVVRNVHTAVLIFSFFFLLKFLCAVSNNKKFKDRLFLMALVTYKKLY